LLHKGGRLLRSAGSQEGINSRASIGGMKCPHCLTAFHHSWVSQDLQRDGTSIWKVLHLVCPQCRHIIVKLHEHAPNGSLKSDAIVHPKSSSRPVPAAVPEPFSTDFSEASLVLADSPKASAALSRRVLQHIIREKAGIKERNLDTEIQVLIDSGKLPSHLSEAIDGVRVVGNFAAHPIKSTNTGEVVDVEPGEAEWLLDTLEGLFDFYFVQPAVLKVKRDAINAKLQEAGKPPLK